MGFVDRPQSLWWRKAIFQVHLWSGVVLGLYVLVVSITGSALVFHWEIEMAPAPNVEESKSAIDYSALAAAAERAHPGFRATGFLAPSGPTSAAQVFLESNQTEMIRFLNPVTGADLGPVKLHKPLEWLADLHVNLLAGPTGNVVNGVGAICLGVMSLTGIVLWWPGRRDWRRSLSVKWRAKWKRVNWDLHSAVGFWTFVLVFFWAFSGTYFVFPDPFLRAFSLLTPMKGPRDISPPSPAVAGQEFAPIQKILEAAEQATPGAVTTWIELPHKGSTQVRIIRHLIYEPWAPHHPSVYINSYTGEVQGVDISMDATGDHIQRWFGYLHFGNFGGTPVKLLWVFLGLAPALLTGTGLVMWWNRSLSKKWHRRRRQSVRAGG